VITKSFNILLFLLSLIFLSIIWGIDQREILVFASSIFAIIGVALFAQWSILSNITAGIIVFFSFPYRIGDKIKILNKDYPVEGVIEDIALFYLFIRDDQGFLTTIPNNFVLQNGITKI
jgi:small-conductance mechanosensitive channel